MTDDHHGRDAREVSRPSATGRVARVLSQVWLSSLIGWVGGVDGPEVVGDDLERAARMLDRVRTCSSVRRCPCTTTSLTCSRRSSTSVPDRTALVVGDTRRTFAELEDRSNRLAHHLARRRDQGRRPRGDLRLQRRRVGRGDDRALQDPRRPGERQLPLRRERAALPLRQRRPRRARSCSASSPRGSPRSAATCRSCATS